MTNINDFGFPFTSVDGDRVHGAAEWRDYFTAFTISGVVTHQGNELKVNPQGSPNKTVYVDTGAALLQGAMRILTGTTNLTIADNSSGNPRIDRIVARLNYADRKIELAVKQGTPGASPVAPSLTRDATAYEISLAKIAAANGFTTIIEANITDERADTTVCGAANFTLGVIPPSGADALTIMLSAARQAIFGAANVEDAMANASPAGETAWFACATPPTGWLACNGAAISRTTYSRLYQALVTDTAKTFTVTIATPGVFTVTAHGFVGGEVVRLSSTGALPTGLTANTDYYVKYVSANTFNLSTTLGGANINTTGTQSGVHTLIRSIFGLGDGSTTFNLPDLRASFIRGLDNGKGIDANRVLGALQASSKVATSYGTNSGTSVGSVAPVDTDNGFRPYNMALLPCIKY